VVYDPEHRARWAVVTPARLACRARATGRVDLADHALADPLGRTRLDDPHELVSRHAREGHVAGHQLQVCGADAGFEHTNSGLSLLEITLGEVVPKTQVALLKPETTHVATG
jgi:hypothetical protein